MKKEHKKKGMTIVEMLVAIAIFTMGIAGFTMLFSKTWKSYSFALEEGESSSMGSNAIQKITKELRKIRYGADNVVGPIAAGSDDSLTVYLNDDADTNIERVHYFLDNQQLKKGVTDPTGTTYPTNDQVVTVMANYVMNTNAQPVFQYYPKNDFVNPMDTTSLDIPNVRLIRVHLWINIKPLTAPENVNFETFVYPRNINE